MLKAMFISRLVVRDFRSYPQAQLCLQPGVTVLLGPNGAGKTNLVEALAYPAMVGSHRVSSDAVLVRHGAAHAVVQVVAVRQGRQASVDVLIGMGGMGFVYSAHTRRGGHKVAIKLLHPPPTVLLRQFRLA